MEFKLASDNHFGRPFTRAEIRRRFNERHPGYVVRYNQRYRGRHRRFNKLHPEYGQRYRKLHPEIVAAISRRRANKRGNHGHYTHAEGLALKKKYGFRCLCCGNTEKQLKRLGRVLLLDHVVALSDPSQKLKGRRDLITNMQPLCHSLTGFTGGCNNRKNAKHIDYRPRP